MMLSSPTVFVSFCLLVATNGFTVTPEPQLKSSALHMGLFDGVKEAFAAPARTTIDAERETPIDRWMGWSVTKEKDMDNAGVASPQACTLEICVY
jgi:hypothetical protein